MSQNSFEIEFKIKPTKFEIEMKDVVKEVFPELEDLEITPSGVEQNFKSDKYGYNNVTVKAIETEEITIQPETEEQVKEGVFNKVIVLGDEDLKPENIKKGTNIFGVEGIGNMTNAKITDCSHLFWKGARIDNLDNILVLCDWDKITNCNEMFYSCSSITSLDVSNFNTSNVTNMRYMFNSCSHLESLDVSNFDTSNVVTMEGMFAYIQTMSSIDLSNFVTSNVTDMSYMFASSNKFVSLNLSDFDTSNVVTMKCMFSWCSKLESLDISSFDMSNVNYVDSMIYYCMNLVDLKFGKNLGKSYKYKTVNSSDHRLDLSYCTKLTHDSLMSVINNLYDLNITYSLIGDGTLYRQNLKLGSTNLAKLTAEEIAIATNKGWNVT